MAVNGAHQYWKEVVYSQFDVDSIKAVLNVEPAIDHEDYYNATIPTYFKPPNRSWITLNWIDANFNMLSNTTQHEAMIVVCESASIFAADAMCHPRARVGKFDWSDVVNLHECLHTPFVAFFQKYSLWEDVWIGCCNDSGRQKSHLSLTHNVA